MDCLILAFFAGELLGCILKGGAAWWLHMARRWETHEDNREWILECESLHEDVIRVADIDLDCPHFPDWEARCERCPPAAQAFRQDVFMCVQC